MDSSGSPSYGQALVFEPQASWLGQDEFASFPGEREVLDDDGSITVLKAGTDKPEVVARNPRLGERTWATPAIADQSLYVRTDKHLYAFTEGAAAK